MTSDIQLGFNEWLASPLKSYRMTYSDRQRFGDLLTVEEAQERLRVYGTGKTLNDLVDRQGDSVFVRTSENTPGEEQQHVQYLRLSYLFGRNKPDTLQGVLYHAVIQDDIGKELSPWDRTEVHIDLSKRKAA